MRMSLIVDSGHVQALWENVCGRIRAAAGEMPSHVYLFIASVWLKILFMPIAFSRNGAFNMRETAQFDSQIRIDIFEYNFVIYSFHFANVIMIINKEITFFLRKIFTPIFLSCKIENPLFN